MKALKLLAATAALAVVSTAASAATLDDVKKKGFIQCGVTTGHVFAHCSSGYP